MRTENRRQPWVVAVDLHTRSVTIRTIHIDVSMSEVICVMVDGELSDAEAIVDCHNERLAATSDAKGTA